MARDDQINARIDALSAKVDDVYALVEKVELSINSRMSDYIHKIEEAAEQATQLARLLGAEAERNIAREEARQRAESVDAR